MMNVLPVVLCGGSGTRLWPLSRSGFPKQFLCLTGTESLYQQTARRLHALSSTGLQVAPPLVVCNEEHRFLAWEQWRETGLPSGDFLLEPVGRNTAPALTMAALAATESGADPVLVVTPSDHVVQDEAAFARSISLAAHAAIRGDIAILGVTPDRPDTGYGYIRALHPAESAGLYEVERFIEKPDLATAQGYLREGGYFWNAGMFVLKASVWLDALSAFRPDIRDATNVAWQRRREDRMSDRQFVRPDAGAFDCVPAESVDYAVMEKCPGGGRPVVMAPLAAGWSDLGAWDAVWQALPRDDAGNARLGDVLLHDSKDTLVHAAHRVVATAGVRDLVIVETVDAVLVADRRQSQAVKDIVGKLAEYNREEHLLHRKVHRPWGWYDSVDDGERFKVKRIQVKPKASLSLQMHHHRAEHWVVVKGIAHVTNGDKVLVLRENESTFIPVGMKHRLENQGDEPLEIIEVQSGDYLGEDDIVRFEDNYGRLP